MKVYQQRSGGKQRVFGQDHPNSFSGGLVTKLFNGVKPDFKREGFYIPETLMSQEAKKRFGYIFPNGSL